MFHSGTFNGNNVTMAAGLATMVAFDSCAVKHVNRLGDRLRAGFNKAFSKAGLNAQAGGIGSLVQIQWRAGELLNARDTAKAVHEAGELPRLFHLEMLNRGVIAAARGQYSTSTCMTDRSVNTG
jgi:glutamate-1-semialdehyde 2,1-aminomutase